MDMGARLRDERVSVSQLGPSEREQLARARVLLQGGIASVRTLVGPNQAVKVAPLSECSIDCTDGMFIAPLTDVHTIHDIRQTSAELQERLGASTSLAMQNGRYYIAWRMPASVSGASALRDFFSKLARAVVLVVLAWGALQLYRLLKSGP